jgi:hypothetical protein
VLAARGLISQTPPPRWARLSALHCTSSVGGCGGFVGGLHRRSSCAGYQNDDRAMSKTALLSSNMLALGSSPMMPPPGWIDEREPFVGLL